MPADAPASRPARRTWTLVDADGREYASPRPGTLGGHRRERIYGRLDCPAALRAIGRGGYVRRRVFFADEPTAIAAGFRPCAVCMPAEYARWKAAGRAGAPASP
ncbi:MAG TPA: Ada metal-binding domain-containing protein [Solirubrobacteraceae bacterium]|nr:Ada metal-binding domain-containing protein [Solirubrobacteraceae bacterium]